jgi:hypothetical protein
MPTGGSNPASGASGAPAATPPATAGSAVETDGRPCPAARIAELVALYGGLPVALAVCRRAIEGIPVIPVLWVAALPMAVWLRRRRARGASETSASPCGSRNAWKREWPRVLLRACLGFALLWGWMRWQHPEWLWSLPAKQPKAWLAVVAGYPVLSVVPQGVVYRAFFRERYAACLRNRAMFRLAAALCFAFSHVVFLHWQTVALTFLGGLLFTRTYERTDSLGLSNLEHALYGAILFTLGYDRYLAGGTLALIGP